MCLGTSEFILIYFICHLEVTSLKDLLKCVTGKEQGNKHKLQGH